MSWYVDTRSIRGLKWDSIEPRSIIYDAVLGSSSATHRVPIYMGQATEVRQSLGDLDIKHGAWNRQLHNVLSSELLA